MSRKSNNVLVNSLVQFRKLNGFSNTVKHKRKKKNSRFRSMAQFERGEPKTFIVQDDGTLEKKNAGAISSTKMSKGELLIYTYLKNKEIAFEREKSFPDCINPHTRFEFRFDFFLPRHNVCIEFDGEQHFKKSKKFGDTQRTYQNRRWRDWFKTAYCRRSGITLVRIKFNQIKSLHSILVKSLPLMPE